MEIEVRTIWLGPIVHDPPFIGTGLVIVTEQSPTCVTLLYPPTLEEFTLPPHDLWQDGKQKEQGYSSATGDGDLLWPVNQQQGVTFNPEKLAALLRQRVQYCALYGKAWPARTVVKVLSQLEDKPLGEVEESLRGQVRATQAVPEKGKRLKRLEVEKFRLKKKGELPKGRVGVILTVLGELGEATLLEVIEGCRGKLKTETPLERVVTYFVNKLTKEGVLERLGEQLVL